MPSETYRAWYQCFAGCPGEHELEEIIYHCPKCGSLLEVQQVEGTFPLRPTHIGAVYNGRLRLPYSDPILFFGSQKRGEVMLRLYAKGIGVQDTLDAVALEAFRLLKDFPNIF